MGQLRVLYGISGLHSDYHTFTPLLVVEHGGDDQEIEPTLIESRTSTNGEETEITAVYEVPAESSVYWHKVKGNTLTASKLFDINSITVLRD